MYRLNKKRHDRYLKKVFFLLLFFGLAAVGSAFFGGVEDACTSGVCFNDTFGLLGLIFWLSVIGLMIVAAGVVLGLVIRILLVDSHKS